MVSYSQTTSIEFDLTNKIERMINDSNLQSYAWLIIYINYIINQLLILGEGPNPIQVKFEAMLGIEFNFNGFNHR